MICIVSSWMKNPTGNSRETPRHFHQLLDLFPRWRWPRWCFVTFWWIISCYITFLYKKYVSSCQWYIFATIHIFITIDKVRQNYMRHRFCLNSRGLSLPKMVATPSTSVQPHTYLARGLTVITKVVPPGRGSSIALRLGWPLRLPQMWATR